MKILLTQEESDELIAMKKIARQDKQWEFPDFGGRLEIPLLGKDQKEEFVLNYFRNSLSLVKRNHQLRTRKTIVLARLDLDGPPHRNPDGSEIGPRHLHLYREGFWDKWAFAVPQDKFLNLDDAFQTLEDFMIFCNIVESPNITKTLFS